MTTDQFRRQRLAQFIRHIWDEGNVDVAGEYLAETYTIHHDPGDPWAGAVLDLAGFKDRVLKSRAAFPDQVFNTQAMFADNGAVVMTWCCQSNANRSPHDAARSLSAAA